MSDSDPKLLHATLGVGVTVAGRYVIRRVIGKGGMGQVFEVENEAIGRHFALKIISLSFASDEAIKRFRREAKALGRVASARVAQVIDFDVDAQLGPFLVMELLEGETLQQRLLRTGRMPVDEAVALGIELCEALAEVHKAGIVHRDLKPSNVGLPKGGPVAVKLLDFGLAASVDDAFTERLTQSQQFLGTLPYMAPELFHGQPPTQALDLYALGVVLYEMLAGRTPFIASNPAGYVAQHLTGKVPRIDSVVSGARVPAWLETIVTRLLAKEAAERYASASAVASALRAADSMALDSTMAAASGAISGVVAAVTPVATKRRVKLAPIPLAIAVATIAVALGVAVSLLASRGKHEPPPPVAAKVETTSPPKVETTPPPKVETPPPLKVETPPPSPPKPEATTKPAKRAHKATAKRTRKSWNGEILEE